jgi:hypothetical protein
VLSAGMMLDLFFSEKLLSGHRKGIIAMKFEENSFGEFGIDPELNKLKNFRFLVKFPYKCIMADNLFQFHIS